MLKYSEEESGYVVPITEEFLAVAPKLHISELSGWDEATSREDFHNYYGEYSARPYC